MITWLNFKALGDLISYCSTSYHKFRYEAFYLQTMNVMYCEVEHKKGSLLVWLVIIWLAAMLHVRQNQAKLIFRHGMFQHWMKDYAQFVIAATHLLNSIHMHLHAATIQRLLLHLFLAWSRCGYWSWYADVFYSCKPHSRSVLASNIRYSVVIGRHTLAA